MFFNKSFVLAAALVCSTSAAVVVERAADPALAPLANIPPACQQTCAVLAGLSSIDPSNLSSLSAVCTPAIAQSFQDCIVCFERESPQTFTPSLLTTLQQSVDSLGTGCLLIGSPVSSITVPTPTGGAAHTNSTASGTGTGSATAPPATATPSTAVTTTTSSRNNAMGVRVGGASLVGVLAAVGASLFL